MTSRRQLFKLATPVFISLLAQNIIGVTDTAFIGRLGEAEMGGVAMATLLYFSIYTLGHALGSGTQIIISRRYGQGRTQEIGTVMAQSLYMLLGLSLLLLLVGRLGGGPFFRLVLISERVSRIANEYWQIRIFGFFLGFVGASFAHFM